MALKTSWVASANQPDTDFPLNNLPYGVIDAGNGARIGLVIGDRILDLARQGGDLIYRSPGWQKQLTDQRPDTFTQANTSSHNLQPRGGPYVFRSAS